MGKLLHVSRTGSCWSSPGNACSLALWKSFAANDTKLLNEFVICLEYFAFEDDLLYKLEKIQRQEFLQWTWISFNKLHNHLYVELCWSQRRFSEIVMWSGTSEVVNCCLHHGCFTVTLTGFEHTARTLWIHTLTPLHNGKITSTSLKFIFLSMQLIQAVRGWVKKRKCSSSQIQFWLA